MKILTRDELENNEHGSGLIVILPIAYPHIGDIMALVQEDGFKVIGVTMHQLNAQDIRHLSIDSSKPANMDLVSSYLQCDPILVMQIGGGDSAGSVAKHFGGSCIPSLGPTQPDGLKSLFANHWCHNAVYFSQSGTALRMDLEFLSGIHRPGRSTALHTCCAVCIIKPHVVNPHGGSIISIIQHEGLEISALQTKRISQLQLDTLLRAYRGILPCFNSFCEELLRGVAIVLEVRGQDVVERLRRLAGPLDPHVAKVTAPDSIRARFGSSIAQNAIYHTDIATDGPFESRIFFTDP